MGWRVGACLVVLALSAACADTDTVSTDPTVSTEAPLPQTTSTRAAPQAAIEVTVRLAAAPLFGPALGVVRDERGVEVATFKLASAWIEPDSWQDVWDGTTELEATGIAPVAAVILPAPGRYTFELGEFVTSSGPCGTCEAGMSGGSVSVDVNAGDAVDLDPGTGTWMS